ncbi:hypothetical protein M407DRAFT_220085 [Tulasnella calospora MUT 4182]|uniref:Uncharacterized protein n=1 Tax=Tulasnella calospora MUT 4182 TaxID=1051891 RepID=A0A0C3KGM2_9AGAM|nr:hypothetical protein M407DRAFT_220085 [Tulasnella calospora MUT 4182]
MRASTTMIPLTSSYYTLTEGTEHGDGRWVGCGGRVTLGARLSTFRTVATTPLSVRSPSDPAGYPIDNLSDALYGIRIRLVDPQRRRHLSIFRTPPWYAFATFGNASEKISIRPVDPTSIAPYISRSLPNATRACHRNYSTRRGLIPWAHPAPVDASLHFVHSPSTPPKQASPTFDNAFEGISKLNGQYRELEPESGSNSVFMCSTTRDPTQYL